ncbi:uncharacterized protein PG986_003308 [Apiospora aurea]|uniref:Uncharacterized protein n=1 Tax=Apiospora aurea TaxID=335848 RepID=A0ABR1QRA9_9PEZI
MFRGTPVSKACLPGIPRGFHLRSHATNPSRGLLITSRIELAKLASSSYHGVPTTDLEKSELPSFFARSRLPTSSNPRTIVTGPRSYHVSGSALHIYSTRSNSPSKISTSSQKGISSKWYSTGGPAGPARDGASTEISKFWDGLRTLLEAVLEKGRSEFAMITIQTDHIFRRVKEYHEVEPGNRFVTGLQVHTKILRARTKLKKYNDMLMSAALLVGMDQTLHGTLGEMERALLRLDNKLEKCQNRLRARELDPPKRRDEEKRHSENSLSTYFALAQAEENDSRSYDDVSTDGFDGIGL